VTRASVPDAGKLRRITLDRASLEYRLIRSRRRSIAMEIDRRGLVVRAPRWVALRDIELALRERASWIVESLAAWRSRPLDTLPTEWRAGAPLLYRGRALTLALFAARRERIAADLLNLTVLHPTPGDSTKIGAFVCRWLKEQAIELFAARALEFARRLDTAPPAVRLSNARSQWGSCNERGEIRLHWRLVQLEPPLADYVVAHEVAHLVELNHSPRFWALVERLLPDHREQRRRLDALTPLLD